METSYSYLKNLGKIFIILSVLIFPLENISSVEAAILTPDASVVDGVENKNVTSILDKRKNRVTQEQRQAAADAQNTGVSISSSSKVLGGIIAPMMTITAPLVAAVTVPAPGGTPNYFGPEPNWAYTPLLRKFVDTLPGLGSANTNNLGQYIPIAAADTATYPGSDYYEIGLVQYTEKMHSDLPVTTLRGYVQLETSVNASASKHIALKYPNGNPILNSSGAQVFGFDNPHYLGPTIVAQKDKPTRIKFTNFLPTGTGGNLFIPVDTSVMGAGMGPLDMPGMPGMKEDYTQNRATLHLHGGNTPWISDGTPHQWTTPAGENTQYPEGVSVSNVPDMPDPGVGSLTFFYSNQQSARLMFYHDHAFGITRLNVYAGEAAGYLLTDATEQNLISTGVIPSDQIPLIIQDKTFVDATTIRATDPTWNWGPTPGTPHSGDLWIPHVYMPNQNPNSNNGVNPFGRWDYGPWFWPPWPAVNAPITKADGTEVPNVPDVSMGMEAFNDTPLVNGTAYPSLTLQPKAYRFRILNAANDRFWNLQLIQADPTVISSDGRANTDVKVVPFTTSTTWPAGYPTPDTRDGGVPDPTTRGPVMTQIGTEGGFLPAPVTHNNIPIGFDMDGKSITVGNVKEHNLLLGPAERADVIVDFSAYAGKTLILYNDAPAAFPASDPRLDYYTGNPDMTTTGGTTSTLAGFGPNTRTIMQIKIAAGTPIPFNLTPLNTALPAAFASSQDQIIVPQEGYNAVYNGNFPNNRNAYARIQDTSLTFTPLGGTTPVTIPFAPKAIAEEFESVYGRMSGFLGLELPFTNGGNQTTIFYDYQDPTSEIINDTNNISTAQIGTLGDGTQIWKITHNGVDTHPIHFHLFNVQLVNRVDWAGVVKPPEPNELGWKETVRMNPLEDAIVALRPVSPKQPFGIPESVRPLDPTMPLGTTAQFKGVDANGNPITVTNELANFGWEYVWHCHILSHEEMDMMRPIKFNVASTLPITPGLNATKVGNQVNLTWTDGTPVSNPTTLGNPANEVGFRVERAIVTGGNPGIYTEIGKGIANSTTFTDTAIASSTTYSYRVVAFNAAGDASSAPRTVSITGTVCQTGADTSGNGIITIAELLAYISRWKAGNVTMQLLMQAISFWKIGTGC
ncbi:MAG: multicopper oxidase domain-containing protein [Candidatus Paceibacterota bacterium]|jgi:FtsP/CotA-like multicopper oxidase with cupredoxin domain